MALLTNCSVCVFVLFCFVLSSFSSTVPQSTDDSTTQTTTTTTQTPITSSTTVPIPTTSLTPEQECHKHNGSCKDCVAAASSKCLYCYTDDSCVLYPYKKVIPDSSVCALSKARWSVCWLNFEAMLIGVGVIAGVIFLTITCCCVYCCCCRGGGNNKKWAREDDKWERQKKDRQEKSSERRAERKDRLDEIRRKYGLVKEDNAYERFDA